MDDGVALFNRILINCATQKMKNAPVLVGDVSVIGVIGESADQSGIGLSD